MYLLCQGCVHDAGAHGVDGDPVRGEGKGRRRGEADDARLGGGVVGLVGTRAEAGDGRHIDDAAIPLGHHHPPGGLEAEEGGLEIEVKHTIPLRLGYVHQRRDGHVAGVVDQNIQAAHFLDQALDSYPNGGHVQEIDHQRHGASPAGFDFVRNSAGGLVVDVQDGDVEPFACQAQGDAAPDALPCPRDQRHPVVFVVQTCLLR